MRFGRPLKKVEKYWKTGPELVFLSYSSIGNAHLVEYENEVVQCVICEDSHKVEDYKCGIICYIVKMGKICTHITPKCATCGAKHRLPHLDVWLGENLKQKYGKKIWKLQAKDK